MRGSTEHPVGDEKLPLLVPQGGSYTPDLLIPTQALPTKTTTAQHQINNAKHHRRPITTKDDNTLHIYFQNVNGVATEEDLHEYMEKINEPKVDIWGWAEININWIPHMVSKAKQRGNQIFDNFTFVASSSNDPAGFYQQGGTCIGVTNKMTGQIIEADHDNSRLGCWSYVKNAGCNQCQVTIVTAYCPCKQSDPGDSTVTAQQYK
eukprot:10860691-Ditylum_brightwellii.AAC.1